MLRNRPLSSSFGVMFAAAFAFAACGRAGLDPFPNGNGEGGDGANAGSPTTTTTMSGPTTNTTLSGPTSTGGGGEGGSTGCTVAQECEDFDPCTSNFCVGGECSFFLKDDDQDGVVSIACGGFDC